MVAVGTRITAPLLLLASFLSRLDLIRRIKILDRHDAISTFLAPRPRSQSIVGQGSVHRAIAQPFTYGIQRLLLRAGACHGQH